MISKLHFRHEYCEFSCIEKLGLLLAGAERNLKKNERLKQEASELLTEVTAVNTW